jgi:hypothetical protein
MVMVVEKGDSFKYSVEELIELAKGNYPNTTHPREGLVFRLLKDWDTSNEKKNSFKIINNDFLLKK